MYILHTISGRGKLGRAAHFALSVPLLPTFFTVISVPLIATFFLVLSVPLLATIFLRQTYSVPMLPTTFREYVMLKTAYSVGIAYASTAQKPLNARTRPRNVGNTYIVSIFLVTYSAK